MDLHATALRHDRIVRNGAGLTAFVLLCTLLVNFMFTAGYDQQRCAELAALGCMTVFVVVRAMRGTMPVVPSSAALLLTGFFGLGLVSAATAYSLHHAIYEWSIFLLLSMLVLVIADELAQDSSRMPVVLFWTGIICAVYSLRVIVMYAMAVASGFQSDMGSLVVGFSNPRPLNHTQTPLLPLLVLLCLQAPRGHIWRKTWFVVASFWWAILFACEARASILGLCTGCVVVLALRRGQARQFLILMAWTALAGFVLYALLFLLLPAAVGLPPFGTPLTVLERTADNPSNNRNLLWGRALQLITAHPLLGIGPQHFAHFGTDLHTGAHPHDWLLQIGAEWGIPALLCLLGVVFLGARALVRSGRHIPAGDTTAERMLVTLLVACTALLVDGIFSGVLVMPQSQLAIALVVGMGYAWVRTVAPAAAHVRHPLAGRWVFATLVVGALCALLWSLAPTLVAHARGDALTAEEARHNTGSLWPRMWQAGNF